MRAALHDSQREIVEAAEDEPASVADGRAPGEVRNFREADERGLAEFIGEAAQTRAENDADARPQGGPRKNKLRGFFGAGELA